MIVFFKSYIKQHTRTLKSGKVIIVGAHSDKRKVGDKSENKGVRQKRYEENIGRAIEMRRRGDSLQKIGKEIGIDFTTVKDWLVKVGEYEPIVGRVSHEQRREVVDLYAAGVSKREIASKTGVAATSIYKIVAEAGIARSLSEASAIRASKGSGVRSDRQGTKGAFYSSKSKSWLPTDSMFEYVRMSQLDNDPSVISFNRSLDRIPYVFKDKKSLYVPDLEVIHRDGSTTIEEIKPVAFLKDERNIAKFNAASEFYAAQGRRFRIVTENEIGKDNIKNFDPTGLTGMPGDVRKDLTRASHRRSRARLKAARGAGSPGETIAKATAPLFLFIKRHSAT